ncbi:MAG: zinc ribbon domain-containing protein [Candidatus Wallbacteria bacterium]|nr:zinc ribbon domain-containing protein [Candidatus Wallbacteria bacterium]
MPIYEYQCVSCGRVEELLLSMNEKYTGVCPDCGGSMERKVSNISFILKGNGFYLNEYASEDKKRKMAEEKSQKPAAESKPDQKTAAVTPEEKKAGPPPAADKKDTSSAPAATAAAPSTPDKKDPSAGK